MPSIASASPQRSPGKSQPHGPQVSGDGQGKKRCLPFTKGPQSIQSCDSWWGAFWDASFVPFSTKNYAHGMKNEGSWNCHLRIGTSCGNFECIVWLFDIWCHVLICLFVLVFFWRTEVTNKTPPSSKNNFNTSIRTAKRILRILPLHVPAAAVASKHSQKRWQLLNTEKMRKNREVGMKSCSTNVLTADMFYSQVAGDLGGIASTSILQSQTTHALHRLSSNHHQPSLTLIKPSPNIIDPQPLVIGEFSHTFRISTTLLHQPWCFSSFHSRNPWSPKTMSRPGQPAPPVPARYAAFPFAVWLCSLLPAPSKKKQFKVNNQKKYDIQKPSHRKFAPRSQICWSIVLRFFSCKFRTSLHQDLALMSASPSWQTWCSAASPSLRSGAGRPGLRSKRQGRKSIRRTSIFTMSHIPNDPIIKVTEHLFRFCTRQESAHIFLTFFSINHQSHLYL